MLLPERRDDVSAGEPADIGHLFVVYADISGQGAGVTADHERGGKGQGCENDTAPGPPRCLPPLSLRAELLLRWTPLVHEPGQRRVGPRPRQPASTLAEQAPLAIGHDHDRHRISARKMVGLAGHAFAYLAATALLGALAAHAAELMASVPVVWAYSGPEYRPQQN